MDVDFEMRELPLDGGPDLVEVQVWRGGRFVGAGAYTKPYDKDTALFNILDAWLVEKEAEA